MRLAVCFLLLVPTAIAEEPELKSLYDARRWAELHQALQSRKGPALYRGVVAAVFNDDPRAERILRSVIKAAPRSEEAYQAYEWLTHLYFRTGQYRQLMANMRARWSSFPDKSEVKNEQTVLAGFDGLPDQTAGGLRPSTLRHDPGEIFIPISINAAPATYFFDTGAWVNCMSESEAKRIGLAIHDTAGALGTGTGARVGFRTAVAAELVVGRMRFKKVSFAIFRDDQEPWSLVPPGRRGALGIPILLGLRTLRWSQDGTVEIGRKPAPLVPSESNLFFDDDHLAIAAGLGQRTVLATLDTGAQTTDLYEAFAKEFASLLRKSGKKDTTEVRGVGHAERFDSITVPELRFRIGTVDTTLRPAHVLLKQIGARCCVGNLGLDLLEQGRAFKIDFGAMRLDLEPGP